jgi:hypothetical protein
MHKFRHCDCHNDSQGLCWRIFYICHFKVVVVKKLCSSFPSLTIAEARWKAVMAGVCGCHNHLHIEDHWIIFSKSLDKILKGL